jgi:hypothetical protein
MTSKKNRKLPKKPFDMPSAEKVLTELSKAESMDDFFGQEGIFANLFAETLEQLLEAELSEELGYEKYEAKGRNSGNSRNGSYQKKVRSTTATASLSPKSYPGMEPTPTSWKRKSWGCTPKGSQPGIFKTPWPNCTALSCHPPPSARSLTRWLKPFRPGRTGPWRPFTRSSSWTPSTSKSGGTARSKTGLSIS